MTVGLSPRAAEALAYLDALPDFERGTAGPAHGYGLERMQCLLDALGRPDRGVRIAHVAGTKGKGSTAAMLASMLRAAGRRTGLYTSPHLVEFRERIAVDGQLIEPGPLADLVLDMIRPAAAHVEAALGAPPLHFEQVLALALLHFQAMAVQDAMLEVGLGGRLDATNAVADPAVSIIAVIGHDHMQVLGYTLAEIAAEKTAIIRRGGVVVCAQQPPEALEVVRARCAAQEATLIMTDAPEPGHAAAAPWQATVRENTLRGLRLDITGPGVAYPDLRLALPGRHQAANAALAVAALHTLWTPATPPREAVSTGLATVRWPGRLQVVAESPLVLLDGAHTAESAHALAIALCEILPADMPLTLILGIMRDKDLPAVVGPLVAGPLAGRVAHVIVTRSAHARAAAPERIAAAAQEAGAAQVWVQPTPEQALELARRLTPPSGAVVGAGSLSLVGDLLRALPVPAQRAHG